MNAVPRMSLEAQFVEMISSSGKNEIFHIFSSGIRALGLALQSAQMDGFTKTGPSSQVENGTGPAQLQPKPVGLFFCRAQASLILLERTDPNKTPSNCNLEYCPCVAQSLRSWDGWLFSTQPTRSILFTQARPIQAARKPSAGTCHRPKPLPTTLPQPVLPERWGTQLPFTDQPSTSPSRL